MAALHTDEEKSPEIDHAEDYREVVVNQKTVNEAGRLATIAEHDLTLRQAVKAYPRAIFWSVLVSTCIIMEGYDVVLVGSMFGQPAFQRKYGNFYLDINQYQLSGPWQVALGNSGMSVLSSVVLQTAISYKSSATDAFSWCRYSWSLLSYSLCSLRKISRHCLLEKSSLDFLREFSQPWHRLMHPRTALSPFVVTLQCTSTFAGLLGSLLEPVSTKASNLCLPNGHIASRLQSSGSGPSPLLLFSSLHRSPRGGLSPRSVWKRQETQLKIHE